MRTKYFSAAVSSSWIRLKRFSIESLEFRISCFSCTNFRSSWDLQFFSQRQKFNFPSCCVCVCVCVCVCDAVKGRFMHWSDCTLKCICTQLLYTKKKNHGEILRYMWKGHNLEVHCTNIQRKRFIEQWNNTSESFTNNWVWENFREDFTTPALFAGFKGTILIVSSQTLNFEMYYFTTWWIFFTWGNGLLNCVPFTYQKYFWVQAGAQIHFEMWGGHHMI